MLDESKIYKFISSAKACGYIIQENVFLKGYTSLQIGGPARLFSEPYSIAEIQFLVKRCKALDIPFYVLGNGSNTLVLDNGFQGLILVSKTNLNHMGVQDATNIVVQAGASLKAVCEFAYLHALSGIEFAYGIPASVGGAIFMNAGAYGGEIKDILIDCTYMDEEGELHLLKSDELFFSYRHSFFSDKKVVILEATFGLWEGNKVKIKELMYDLLARRKKSQPLEYPSAGSTFKRPVGNYASALIEQAELKGYIHHGAMVSSKHAGFVINHKQATSREFMELIEIIQDTVKKKTGYTLECEIRIIGNEEE